MISLLKKYLFCTFSACFVFTVVLSSMLSAQTKEFRFEKDIIAYEEKSRETPPPENCTMFIGSSTWRLWGDQLEKDFAEFNAVNRGFGGSTIPEQLHVMHRILLPHKPARIVFFCGGNDVASGTSGEKTFENFKTFLSRLWAELPNTEVYFVSFTSAPVREKHHDQMMTLNRSVEELAAKTTGLYYIDTFSTLVDENGRAKEEFFLKDRLHLTTEAQARWVPVIKESLQNAKKSRKAVSLESLFEERVQLGLFEDTPENREKMTR